MDKIITLPCRYTWGNSDGPGDVQTDFGPSMCEPVHNLTLEEIIRDYSRGIVHTTRQAFYDEGDDVHDVEDFEDVVDLVGSSDPISEASPAPPALDPDPAPENDPALDPEQ